VGGEYNYGIYKLALIDIDFYKGADETEYMFGVEFNKYNKLDIVYSDMYDDGDSLKVVINYGF
jgi:hypothetical protein